MRTTLCLILLGALSVPVFAQSELPLMPLPKKVERGTGELPITNKFTAALSGAGATDARVRAAAVRTLKRLERQTGVRIDWRLQTKTEDATLLINVDKVDHAAPQKLGDDESYKLTVTPAQARIDAAYPLGALRGVETLLQLARLGANGFALPVVTIDDAPRFAWRGLSLDVSRHFVPTDAVKRNIDGLAAVKMNVFHWHLSDDQGFRVESKRFPKMQQFATEGQYYTQTEVRDIVAYARERGVRVVPEFDVPGHATAWFAAYPQYASGKGPYAVIHSSGVLPATMDPTRETTYTFLAGLFGEMAALFPDAYFHIGGDEVDPKEWKQNARIQSFIKTHNLTNEHGLQAYFNRRLLKIVTKLGKRMEGWDEILQPTLPKSIMIQSWRGPKSLAEGARQGYDGILSAGYYLDLFESAARHYAVEPLSGDAAKLTPEEQKRIFGGEAAMWLELTTAENIDSRLWPRTAAIAERLWSPADVKDLDSMYARLEPVSEWLEWLDLRHRSNLRLMRQRLANGGDVHALELLATMVEPEKGYHRHRHHYTTWDSFHRFVDTLAPEAEPARAFVASVNRYVAGDASQLPSIERTLNSCVANAPRIVALSKTNSIVKELDAVAAKSETLCRAGLDAVSALKAQRSADADTVKRTLDAVDAAAKPEAEMLNQLAPGVRKLVQATQAK